MFGFVVKSLLVVLLLFGGSHAGLVHHRLGKESSSSPSPLLTTEGLNIPKDHIPVTIIHDPEPQIVQTNLPAIPVIDKDESSQNSETPLKNLEQQQQLLEKIDASLEGQLMSTESPIVKSTDDVILVAPIASQPELPLEALLSSQSSEKELLTNTESASILLENSNFKALPIDASNSNAEEAAPAVPVAIDDELERQAAQSTTATPTQTSTPQNFVAQLIQNSPIGQFLSQFTGNQQQQQQTQQQQQPSQPQQNQQLADQPATPAPTLPGFLNPAAAITSAQQAVQSAAQTVVNSTTQAFQGLQQFATNLGTQFQNTFSNLAGQQNQLTTADSTTPRPPGPIQAIVNSFVNAANATAIQPGQQQGPLQGIISFFQGGNRPQNQLNPITSAPPKEEPTVAAEVNDKIEIQQNDPAVQQNLSNNQEPDTANEVRSSAEVNKDDESFEVGESEDLIVVNDDAAVQ